MLKLLKVAVLAVSLMVSQVPVPLIDLTNVIVHHRLREPTTASASGHLIGYEGGVHPPPPLTLRVISLKKDHSDPALTAELEILNVSKEDLDIPVDPSSRDFEPTSPAVPYRYLKAYIWLMRESGAQEKMPSTGLFLYGGRAVPMSLQTLKSGQAVRIRAKIPAGSALHDTLGTGTDTSQTKSLRAFFALFNESITPQKDGPHSATEEVFPTISSSVVVESPL
jgi:hypothetical protein